MAIFEYQALTASGRLMKGDLEAASAKQARQTLAEMQFQVQSLDKAPARPPKARVGRNELLLFNQQLASITKAGIPLERGLRELAADVQSRSVRSLIENLAADLEAGTSVEEAFEKRKDRFPPLYGQIVKAGVQSGRLGEMLTSLNRHLEVAGRTRRVLREALTYPAVILVIGALLLTAVFLFLIPQFKETFQDMGLMLPAATEAVFWVSDHLPRIGLGLAAALGTILLAWSVLSTTPGGRRVKETLLLHTPALGAVCRHGMLSRLTDSMAVLVSARCDLPTALRLGAAATGSELLKGQCEMLAGRLERGENLLEAGAACPALPPLLLYSMQLGAQRNELQDSLYSLSDMYAEQTLTGQARLQSLLPPVMLLAVGGVIALAIMSIFLPFIAMIRALSSGV